MTAPAFSRELRADEFVLANTVWIPYHQTHGDPDRDRIFGVFSGDDLVSLARCRRHPDGYEVDAVFTPADRRGHGYARLVMDALIEACQHDTLYMHSVLELTGFYAGYGFVPIGEQDLPPTIKARFDFAQGELEQVNVRPMKRPAGRFRKKRSGTAGPGDRGQVA